METTEEQYIRKTRDKLTFAEFCDELRGYNFYRNSDLDQQVHKHELFFFYNFKTASDAFYRFFSKKREL